MKAFFAVWLLVLTCWGQLAQAQAFDRLYETSPQPVLAAPLQWVGVPKAENVSEFKALPAVFVNAPSAWAFADVKPNLQLPTSPTQDVWMRFTLSPTDEVKVWYLRMPKVTLNNISLFTRDAQGAWQIQTAGQHIAPATWPLRARVPTFELKTSTTEPQTFFIYFEHPTRIAERPQLLSAMEYITGAYAVGAMMGVLGGMFSLIAALCIAAYAIARNTHFLWLCGFVVILLFNQLTLLGFTGWQLWPHSQHLNQVMPWAVALASLATATWFVARTSYASDTHPALYRLLGGLAIVSLVLAVATAIQVDLVDRDFRNAWSALMVTFVLGGLGWLVLRGNRFNGMLLLGMVPTAWLHLAVSPTTGAG